MGHIEVAQHYYNISLAVRHHAHKFQTERNFNKSLKNLQDFRLSVAVSPSANSNSSPHLINMENRLL